jgi:phospholipase C
MQEKGIRTSCALPYELYTHGKVSDDKKSFELKLMAGNQVFGKNAAGSPFTVSAPVKYNDETSKDEISRNWSFAVKAGDALTYSWPFSAFENNRYHLRVNGPNGFFREFMGNDDNPPVTIHCDYEKNKLNTAKLTGNIVLTIINNDSKAHNFVVNDNSYKTGSVNKAVAAYSKVDVVLDMKKNYQWYDFSVKLNGHDAFGERFAGRVETGMATKTDPFMGGIV